MKNNKLPYIIIFFVGAIIYALGLYFINNYIEFPNIVTFFLPLIGAMVAILAFAEMIFPKGKVAPKIFLTLIFSIAALYFLIIFMAGHK
ncbi:hypothetical protein K8R42_02880 [bacterium]|nr:hypothetical protein [bacterium]